MTYFLEKPWSLGLAYLGEEVLLKALSLLLEDRPKGARACGARSKRPLVEVGIGDGRLYRLIQKTFPDEECFGVDPIYSIPKGNVYPYLADLILARPDLVGNAILILNWPDPNADIAYDYEALALLRPQHLLAVMETQHSGGNGRGEGIHGATAGSVSFHRYLSSGSYVLEGERCRQGHRPANLLCCISPSLSSLFSGDDIDDFSNLLNEKWEHSDEVHIKLVLYTRKELANEQRAAYFQQTIPPVETKSFVYGERDECDYWRLTLKDLGKRIDNLEKKIFADEIRGLWIKDEIHPLHQPFRMMESPWRSDMKQELSRCVRQHSHPPRDLNKVTLRSATHLRGEDDMLAMINLLGGDQEIPKLDDKQAFNYHPSQPWLRIEHELATFLRLLPIRTEELLSLLDESIVIILRAMIRRRNSTAIAHFMLAILRSPAL
jgi:hypothetical protein